MGKSYSRSLSRNAEGGNIMLTAAPIVVMLMIMIGLALNVASLSIASTRARALCSVIKQSVSSNAVNIKYAGVASEKAAYDEIYDQYANMGTESYTLDDVQKSIRGLADSNWTNGDNAGATTAGSALRALMTCLAQGKYPEGKYDLMIWYYELIPSQENGSGSNWSPAPDGTVVLDKKSRNIVIDVRITMPYKTLLMGNYFQPVNDGTSTAEVSWWLNPYATQTVWRPGYAINRPGRPESEYYGIGEYTMSMSLSYESGKAVIRSTSDESGGSKSEVLAEGSDGKIKFFPENAMSTTKRSDFIKQYAEQFDYKEPGDDGKAVLTDGFDKDYSGTFWPPAVCRTYLQAQRSMQELASSGNSEP